MAAHVGRHLAVAARTTGRDRRASRRQGPERGAQPSARAPTPPPTHLSLQNASVRNSLPAWFTVPMVPPAEGDDNYPLVDIGDTFDCAGPGPLGDGRPRHRVRRLPDRGEIGRGGMGVVYRARHLALDRECALKLISPALSNDPHSVSAFSGSRGWRRRWSTRTWSRSTMRATRRHAVPGDAPGRRKRPAADGRGRGPLDLGARRGSSAGWRPDSTRPTRGAWSTAT